MLLSEPLKCFVVMPFGVKPIHEAPGGFYDFDKVYRVIIQPAIKLAGMEPKRADEGKGSSLIHTDMFKDLRDQKVVLADLSLHNPNVFYELGIRHVMRPRGTVLMCRSGSDLPFDVKLSRVIFYKFDGQSLDWEEAERVIKELKQGLDEAKRGAPDSPVYALLEQVLPDQDADATPRSGMIGDGNLSRESLDAYQELVANHWAQQGRELADLQKQHSQLVFGARTLGYFCLGKESIPAAAREVARSLYYVEQYDLANRLYRKLDQAGALTVRDLLYYGSSLSEADSTVSAAEKGIEYQMKALDLVQAQLKEGPVKPEVYGDLVRCYPSIAGLHHWKWELTRSEEDLNTTIAWHEAAVDHCEREMPRVESFPVGRLAQTRLRLMLMLRIRDQNRERPDTEHHREAILALRPRSSHPAQTVSYLRWYQAITMADGGDTEGSRSMSLRAFLEDAQSMNRPDGQDIGRRQYSSLRRFIEHNLHVLRNPSLVGQISQVLQVGHRPGNQLLEPYLR